MSDNLNVHASLTRQDIRYVCRFWVSSGTIGPMSLCTIACLSTHYDVFICLLNKGNLALVWDLGSLG